MGPVITSADTVTVSESLQSGTVFHTVETGEQGVKHSIDSSNGASSLANVRITLDEVSGEISLKEGDSFTPTDSPYSFPLIATDTAGNLTTHTLTVNVEAES